MSERANRLSRRTKCIITTVSVVFILYVILVNVLVSAALVPSFMRRLDKFQQITDKSISEQVHTQDIEANSDSQLSETDAWLADCEAIKYSMKNEDGYNLIPIHWLPRRPPPLGLTHLESGRPHRPTAAAPAFTDTAHRLLPKERP